MKEGTSNKRRALFPKTLCTMRKYIASFVGFAPADDPEVLAMAVIYNPQGVYYGGTIAAPVVRDIFDNVLPYLGIEKQS